MKRGLPVVLVASLLLLASAPAWAQTGVQELWSTRLGGPVYAVAWSPDGALLAAGGNFTGVAVFERTGPHSLVLRGIYTDLSLVDGLSWDPSGRILYMGASGVTLAALDVDTGRLVYVERGATADATAVMDQFLAVGGDNFVALYLLDNGVPRGFYAWYGQDDVSNCLGKDVREFFVLHIVAEPYNRMFYAAGLYVDRDTGRQHALVIAIDPVNSEIYCLDENDLGMSNEIAVTSLALVPGAWIVVAGSLVNGLAEIIYSTGGEPNVDLNTRVQAVPVGDGLASLAWSDRLGLVAASLNNPALYVSNPINGDDARKLVSLPARTGVGYGVSVNPATGDIVVGCVDGTVRLYGYVEQKPKTVTVTRTATVTVTSPVTVTNTVTLERTLTSTVTDTVTFTTTLVQTVVNTIEYYHTLTETVTSTATTTLEKIETTTATATVTETTTRTATETITLVSTVKPGVEPGAALLATSLIAAGAMLSAAIAARRL